MFSNRISRRKLLGYAAIACTGLLAQACTKEKIVEVTKVVKETVVVEGAPKVEEKVVKETVVVEGAPKEKVVTATPEPKKAHTGPAIVRMSVWGAAVDQAVYAGIATLFEKQVTDIALTMETYVGNYYTKLMTNFAAGNSADVLYTQGFEWQMLADLGLVRPLDDYIAANNAQSKWPDFEIYKQSTVWHDQTYMSPMDSGCYSLFYNKDIFDKRGEPYPTDDLTWDEFKAKVARLTFDEGGKHTWGYMHECYEFQVWAAIMRKDGNQEWDQIVEPTKAQWDQPDLIAEIDWIAREEYVQKWAPIDSDWTAGISFWNGNGAMAMAGPWYLANAWGPKAVTPGGLNYGVVEPPKGKTGKIEMPAQCSGHMIAKDSKVPEAAFKVIMFLTDDDAQKRIADGGRMPAQLKIAKEYWPGTVKDAYNVDNPQAFITGQQEGRYFVISGGEITLNRLTAAGQALPAAKEAMMAGALAKDLIPDVNVKLQAKIDEYWSTRK